MIGTTNAGFTRTKELRAKVWRRYKCSGYSNYGRSVCHQHLIDEGKVFRHVVQVLERDYLNPGNLTKIEAEIERQEEAETSLADPDQARRLRAQIAVLESQIAKGEENLALVDLDLMAGVARKVREWRDRRQQLQTQLHGVEKGPDLSAIRERVADAKRQLWRLREALQSGDPTLVRTVLRELVSKIELYWTCEMKTKRRWCRFVRGIIHLRPDEQVCRLDHVGGPPWI
jgi:hypothetical protein